MMAVNFTAGKRQQMVSTVQQVLEKAIFLLAKKYCSGGGAHRFCVCYWSSGTFLILPALTNHKMRSNKPFSNLMLWGL